MPVPRVKEFGEEISSNAPDFINRKTLSYVGFGIALVVGITMLHSLVDTNNAGFYKIKQAAGSGQMTAITAPGMYFRNFGDVSTYKAADNLYFSKHEDEGRASDDSIEVRYNDGALAKVSGGARFELPADPQKLIDIHKHFRSYDSLVKDTVKQVINEAVILTAALMSAEESYTTKRAEFGQLAEDQVKHGIYLTRDEAVPVKDLKTGETVIKHIVSIQRDEDGKPLRKESVLDQYGIRITQFIVKELDPEKAVADQIAAKQQALMQVVSAKANAEKAIQDRLTAEEVGRKNVAVAQYEMEVTKKKAIVEGEKELEVAKLNRQAAEQNKAKLIAEGEGEGSKRRLIMQADGALTQKLDAYVKTNQAWAEAFAKSQNPVVPGVVVGGSSNGQVNGAELMMQMIGVKAAKDLSLDLQKGTGKTAKSDE